MTTIIDRLRAFVRRWHGAIAAPCQCERPGTWVTVDANGYRRWCGKCGGRLWGAP